MLAAQITPSGTLSKLALGRYERGDEWVEIQVGTEGLVYWQADITHWRLVVGVEVEILNILDDHSRFHALRVFKAADVVVSFHERLGTSKPNRFCQACGSELVQGGSAHEERRLDSLLMAAGRARGRSSLRPRQGGLPRPSACRVLRARLPGSAPLPGQ